MLFTNYLWSALNLWNVTPIEEGKTEEKAKVVAAVWGTEFIQFHAALQI